MVIKMGRPRKYPNGFVILTMSVDPKVAREFEKRRGNRSRGEFLKWLLEVTRELEQQTS